MKYEETNQMSGGKGLAQYTLQNLKPHLLSKTKLSFDKKDLDISVNKTIKTVEEFSRQ